MYSNEDILNVTEMEMGRRGEGLWRPFKELSEEMMTFTTLGQTMKI